MAAHRSTTTRASEGARGAAEVLEVGEVVPTGDSLLGTIAASRTLGAAGDAAAGSVTAPGVARSSRDWMVPVTRPESSATFQMRSEAAGSRRRRRVTSQASPRSALLWIK